MGHLIIIYSFLGILLVIIVCAFHVMNLKVKELQRELQIKNKQIVSLQDELSKLEKYVKANIHSTVEQDRKFYDLTTRTNRLEQVCKILNNGFVTPTQASMY